MDSIKLVLAFIGLLIIGVIFLAGVGAVLQYFDGKKGKFEKRRTSKKKYVTFTKRWFARILANGIVWVYLSYVLALMGKEQIAETLSITAITAILGAFVTYAVKSFSEKKIGKEKEEYENINEEAYQ